MGAKLIKIASVYFVVGVLFGMFMSITHQFQFASVHAHINLVGWVSLAIAGVVYHLFPKAASSALGKVHFWLHNIGLPVMMIGLVLLINGVPGTEPVVAAGGSVTAIAVLLFTINVLRNVGVDKEQSVTNNKTTSL